jgi:hypothetical protein
MSNQVSISNYLRPLVRDFDRIWYGQDIATEADYAQASALYDQILQEISESKSSPALTNSKPLTGSQGVR